VAFAGGVCRRRLKVAVASGAFVRGICTRRLHVTVQLALQATFAGDVAGGGRGFRTLHLLASRSQPPSRPRAQSRSHNPRRALNTRRAANPHHAPDP
jgi:hypothetical protein